MPALSDWLDALTHKLLHQQEGDAVPVGALMSFPLGIPAGAKYLACDGSTFSQTQYPRLATYLGGTTLPDYRGRVLVMQDAAQLEFDVLGETGGSKTQVLLIADLPAHAHTGFVSTENVTHVHTIPVADNNSASDVQGYPASNVHNSIRSSDHGVKGAPLPSTGNPSAAHQHTVPVEGSGGAHNNLQPYKVVTIGIRAG